LDDESWHLARLIARSWGWRWQRFSEHRRATPGGHRTTLQWTSRHDPLSRWDYRRRHAL